MLGVKQYPKEYISSCRKKIKADMEAFKKIGSVTGTFENAYFTNLVLVLETMFMHRMRGQEGKDGNPLNEVRMITNSVLNNNSKLLADNTIKYSADKSVLKFAIDQKIALTENDFNKLSAAFFSDIDKKFS